MQEYIYAEAAPTQEMNEASPTQEMLEKAIYMQLAMRLAVIENILISKNIVSLDDIAKAEEDFLKEINLSDQT